MKSGFVIATGPNSNVTGGNAVKKFLQAMLTAPDGEMEMGIAWDAEHKWSVYQRIGNTGLRMSARDARKLADVWEQTCRNPAMAAHLEALKPIPDALRALALECGRNNTAGKKPDGHKISMPAAGHA